MTFVETVLAYTRNSESPRRYYYWSALAAVAAVLRRQVYLPRGDSRLFPNIFVLLIGKSGLRKGAPVNLAKHLVHAVNSTRVYSGRLSVQGIISDLAKTVTKKDQSVVSGAHSFLVASEFAAFMIKDPDAMTILTDLYDSHYHDTWTYMLRNSPVETLKEPYITMLGASNEIHLKDAIPDNAIGGGFVARTFMIYADKKQGRNPLTSMNGHEMPLSALIARLGEISKAKGPFTWADDAREHYGDWYNKLQDMVETVDDQTGTLERLHDHVQKTAMLISLSRSTELILQLKDVKEAILACSDFTPAARRVGLMQLGKSASAPGTSVLLLELVKNPAHEISRSEALQKHWSHFNHQELDVIAESLLAQKAITLSIKKDDNGRPETFYTINKKVLENYIAKYGMGDKK